MTNLAVIGCGHWGPNHIRTFRALPGAEVTFAVDRDMSRFARMTEMFPGVRCVTEHRVALASAEVEAVVIATPTGTHFQLVRDALDAGKHVLCEKPLCRTGAEADELVALARHQGLVLAVGHVFLFSSGIAKLKDIARNEGFGEMYYLSAARTNLGPVRGDVNAAYDLAAHDISIFNWIMEAEPTSVTATGAGFLQRGIEDVVFLSLTYPGGVVGSIKASWLDPKKVRQITVVGSRRMATWDDLDLSSPVAIYDKGARAIPETNDYGEFLRISTWDGDVRLPKVDMVEPLRAQGLHFLEEISGRANAVSDGRFAAGVVRVLEAAALSLAQNGALIQVPRNRSVGG